MAPRGTKGEKNPTKPPAKKIEKTATNKTPTKLMQMVSMISPVKQQSPSKLQLFVNKMKNENPPPTAPSNIEPKHLIRHFKGPKRYHMLYCYAYTEVIYK